MTAIDRRERLLEVIRQHGFATLPDLSERLKVSESTIRRDLNALEGEGSAKRTHGGVVYTGASPKLPHFEIRQYQNLSRKKAIAATAADLVQTGDTILLDGGSTAYELARLLVDKAIQVITNSLPVANLFVRSGGAEVIFVGGVIQNKTGVALGPYATAMLSSVRCQHAFISAAGVTQSGVFNNNLLLVETERAMMNCADSTTLVVDSSKFGQTSLSLVCDLSQIHRVIVDHGIDPMWVEVLEANSVKTIIAEEADRT